MDETTLAIGRLQAQQKAIADRQDRSEASTNARFLTIDSKLNTADVKLDSLLEAQRVAAAIRADSETRQDRRAKKIAGWSSVCSGIIVVVIGEFVRWVFFHQTGISP